MNHVADESPLRERNRTPIRVDQTAASQSSSAISSAHIAEDLDTHASPLRAVRSTSHTSNEAQKSRKCLIGRIIDRFVLMRRTVIHKFISISASLSDIIFDHPFWCITIFVLISLGLSAGFFVATVEEDVYRLYSLPDSIAHQNAEIIAGAFEAQRPNFIMFNNTDLPGELLKDSATMTGLWSIDNYLRKRMTVPRIVYEDGLEHDHRIWAFLDDQPDLDKGYLRYSDICALRPGLNRGVDSSSLEEREHSSVFSSDWDPSVDYIAEEDLEMIDDDMHCDYATAMSAYKYPKFRSLSTRTFPYFPTSWNRRAVDLQLLFFSPEVHVRNDPKTGQPVMAELTDCGGMMFLYYTATCDEDLQCESILWERSLISTITAIEQARMQLLATPTTEREPLIWVNYEGRVVKTGWYDVTLYCSDDRNNLNIDNSTGNIICDLPRDDFQPPHAMLLNVRKIELSVYGASSWSDELARSTAFDLELMLNYVLSFSVLLIFGGMSMFTRNLYRNKTIIGITAAINGLVGYCAGAGLCYLFGLKHTATMNAVPFLAMGIAMDDAFVMINAYAMTYYLEATNDGTDERSDEKRLSLAKKRCKLALEESSMAITLTTLTNLISFTVGTITPYVAARNFCIICAFGLLGGYIGAFFCYWPVVCIMSRYEHLRRPPPLLMERVLNKCGITTNCQIPKNVFLDVEGPESYSARSVLESNSMVTNRQYRVIRLKNELARRELISASVSVANQFKGIFGKKTYRPTASSGSSNVAIMGSTSSDITSNDVNWPLQLASGVVPRVLPLPADLVEPPNLESQSCVSSIDSVHMLSSDGAVDPEVQAHLLSLLTLAKHDYNEVAPPPGTLSRHFRSATVRIIMTFMRNQVFRWMIVSLFGAWLAWFVYEISKNFKKGLEQLYLVPPDSYLKDSYAMSEANGIYLVEGQMALFVQDGHSISEPEVLHAYIDILDNLRGKYYISSTMDPIQMFHNWLSSQDERVWKRISPTDELEVFDGQFDSESREYEQALLYWNINRSDGMLMNKYLVWNPIPTDSHETQIEDDIPWLNDDKNHLQAVSVVYFNGFYSDVSVQSAAFSDLRAEILDFNEANGDMIKVFEYNSLHPFFESDDIIMRQTLVSMASALVGIAIVTSLLMDSDQILHPNSILVVLMIILMDVTVFGSMALFGIKLNIITMILLVMSIGFSVDYTLHTAHQYVHMDGTLLERLSMTMIYIGLPLLQSLCSTVLAALPLTSRLDEYIFATFFEMVVIVLIVGFAFGVILLPQVLVIIDKFRGELEAEQFRVFIHKYHTEMKSRMMESNDLIMNPGMSPNKGRPDDS